MFRSKYYKLLLLILYNNRTTLRYTNGKNNIKFLHYLMDGIRYLNYTNLVWDKIIIIQTGKE